MSYHDSRENQGEDILRLERVPRSCFLCGREIRDWFVFWSGWTTGIALHGECAEHLGWSLVKDAACVRLEAK